MMTQEMAYSERNFDALIASKRLVPLAHQAPAAPDYPVQEDELARRCPDLLQQLREKTYFYTAALLQHIATLFPASLADIAQLSVAEHKEIWRAVCAHPWRFCFKAHCARTHRALRWPTTLALLRQQGALPVSDAHVAAVEAHGRIKAMMRQTGWGNFFAYQIARFGLRTWRTHLIDEAAALVGETLNGQEVYTTAEQQAAQTLILRGLEAICARRNRAPLAINADYVPAPDLTEDQKLALAAVDQHPIVCIHGLPGRGKTHVVGELYRKYAHCCVLSFVGSMVAALRERGMTTAGTIHSYLIEKVRLQEYVLRRPERLGPMPRVAPELAQLVQAQVLLVDEFTNVDNQLAGLLYALFPRLQRVVHVFDPKQIGPIKPGRMAYNLLEALPAECHVALSTQMRVVDPAARALVTNDEHLLQGRFDAVVARSVEPGSPVPEDAGGWVFVAPPAVYAAAQTRRAALDALRCTVLPALLTVSGGVDPRGCRILTLLNDEKDVVNAYCEAAYNPHQETVKFYRGQPITIVEKNFKAKLVRGNVIMQCDSGAAGGGGGGHKHTRASKAPGEMSDAVKNGEVYIFSFCRDFDLHENKWVTGQDLYRIEQNAVYPVLSRRYRRFIFTQCGKQFCVHPDYVPVEYIRTAWAMTVNKSQGREYGTVCFILPPTAALTPAVFNAHHVHVAVTRARFRLYIVGAMPLVRDICVRAVQPRYDTLRYKIARAYPEWMANLGQYDDGHGDAMDVWKWWAQLSEDQWADVRALVGAPLCALSGRELRATTAAEFGTLLSALGQTMRGYPTAHLMEMDEEEDEKEEKQKKRKRTDPTRRIRVVKMRRRAPPPQPPPCGEMDVVQNDILTTAVDKPMLCGGPPMPMPRSRPTRTAAAVDGGKNAARAAPTVITIDDDDNYGGDDEDAYSSDDPIERLPESASDDDTGASETVRLDQSSGEDDDDDDDDGSDEFSDLIDFVAVSKKGKTRDNGDAGSGAGGGGDDGSDGDDEDDEYAIPHDASSCDDSDHMDYAPIPDDLSWHGGPDTIGPKFL
jgi:hypothetical protein